MKSASWNMTLSSTPALSPALTIFTNIALNTFGCLSIALERDTPLETSSITASRVLFNRGLVSSECTESSASTIGTPAFNITDSWRVKL